MEIWTNKARELFEIKKKIKELEEIENKVTSELKDLSKDETTSFGSFRFLKVIRKGSIDYSKIEVLKDIDLEPYRKSTVTSWKLELIDLI